MFIVRNYSVFIIIVRSITLSVVLGGLEDVLIDSRITMTTLVRDCPQLF